MNKAADIYPPNPLAKPGKHTQALFDEISPIIEEALDVTKLRDEIALWDENCHFPYPENITPNDFKEESIANIPASIYRYQQADSNTPTVLFFHGGGFYCELAKVHQSLMANVITQTPCNAVLPHYALSPESKAPKAIEEATKILHALLTQSATFGLSKNIIVVGYSSGGNLAWNAILNILNTPETKGLVQQISNCILMSPWVDLSLGMIQNTPYQPQQGKTDMVQAWGLAQCSDWYLPDNANSINPLYSPVYRSSKAMQGMPNTTMIVGELDVLLNEAVQSVRVLREGNVATQLLVLEGQTHNHSAHIGLRDGVFSADVIANILRGRSIEGMKGNDGLGAKLY